MAKTDREPVTTRDPADLLAIDLTSSPQVQHHRVLPAGSGELGEWPAWLPAEIISGLQAAGIERPWLHQTQAAELLRSGRHLALSTPTASGKSLAYQLPILAATAVPPSQAVLPDGCLAGNARDARAKLRLTRHTALYISPTKALAHDQRRSAAALGPAGWRIATLDGDSSQAERRFARDQASFVLTNPDMLHRSVLPGHEKWAGLLGSLRYVVIDEAHRYRGVFGAHVAAVLRRLRRLCAAYGANPVFVLASATAAQAEVTGAALIGEPAPLALIEQSTAAHPAREVSLWQPSDSTAHDAADLMASLVFDGAQTLTFVSSRAQAELVALRSQSQLDRMDRAGLARNSALPTRIASYRAGYLAEDRRSIEGALNDQILGGVAATNALELGIDVSGLDAVVIAGFPGTLSAFWQQAGRAGRSNRDSQVVLVAKSDPLDSYLISHPELIFDAPVEATVLNVHNPHVLGPHLAAAAQEAPLTQADERWFGADFGSLADKLTAAGLLRRRPAGWFWTRGERAVDAIDLRGALGKPIDVIDASSGRVIGAVDQSAADRTVHEGAIYLHQGQQWLVEAYLPEEFQALVRLVDADTRGYYTQPKSVSDIAVLSEDAKRPLGRGHIVHGEVELSTQVVGYLRRDEVTSEVWDEHPLALPVNTHRTHAVWIAFDEELTAELGLKPAELGAAAHAAEHTAIGLLPLFSPCDRWDIGGISTVLHPDTGRLTIFVHDGAPGGAGFAEHGFEVANAWWSATLERLSTCGCETGCPACIVSPKCGNANQMLDKHAARALLKALLG